MAVVQLCVDSSRCDVMHILHSGIPPSLVTILEDPSILKVICSTPRSRFGLLLSTSGTTYSILICCFWSHNIRQLLKLEFLHFVTLMVLLFCDEMNDGLLIDLQTGVGSHGDAAKLQRDYGVQIRGVVDLSEMAGQKLGRRWHSWSLSSLAQELTCKKVRINNSFNCDTFPAYHISHSISFKE